MASDSSLWGEYLGVIGYTVRRSRPSPLVGFLGKKVFVSASNSVFKILCIPVVAGDDSHLPVVPAGNL
jgi:hypothetical protein